MKTRNVKEPRGRRRSSTPSARAYEPRPADELCTAEFAADLLQVHPRTIHRYIREGRLPAVPRSAAGLAAPSRCGSSRAAAPFRIG